jgi:4-amino-4-deoxy-L-arabinose transferase-like glycosyltransferase
MGTLALDAPAARPRLSAGYIAGIALFVAAFAIRLPHFGNPAFMIDEQFYLLAGDRLLHGQLPFVDIWDRKPIGLFLIYAATRLLGGEGFVQYQVVATLFAAGTACTIFAIARRTAGDVGATIAGLLYLLWIEIAEGGGGQASVFYNLLVAGAAWLVLDALQRREMPAFRRRAFAAMGLIGLAIQIKYTVVVEGFFFGLVLAWGTLRRVPSPARALGEIALLALTALLPTLAALGFYAAIGQLHAFWFANFSSIFQRAPTDPIELQYRTQMALFRLAPFTICALAGALHLRRDRRPATRRWQVFMACWMGAALGGFFAVGVLYAHYLLPVFLPFSIAAAPIFARWPIGPVLAVLAAWLPASALHYPDFAATTGEQRQMAALAALVPADVKTGCLQMFDGPPILYYLTHACTLSRFVFPDHLSAAIEAHAIGVDPAAEVRRILALRPRAITISDTDVRPPNRETFAIMRTALKRDYQLAGRTEVDGRMIDVWVNR